MSRLISDILQAPEPNFSHQIQNWERLSNRAGHDLRLLSEVSRQRRQTLKFLKLDESDTKPQELYYSLRHYATESNEKLAKKIGIQPHDEPEIVIKKIIRFVETFKLNNNLWVVKHPLIKEFLKKQPPKKLLKALGLRSIDSVLKRRSAYELLVMAYRVESSDWKEKMISKFKRLKPTDFHEKRTEFFLLTDDEAKKLRKAGYKGNAGVIPNYSTGTILIIPPKKRFEFDVSGLAFLILQAEHDLKTYSGFFRHISVKNNFGDRFYEVIKNGLPGKMHELKIGWKQLLQHINRSPETFSKIEQPYLQQKNLTLFDPLELLSRDVPAMNFWKGKNYVFMYKDQKPVSMHLMDVIVNGSNDFSYEKSTHDYLRSGLWDEIGVRYLQSPPVEALSIKEMSND